MKDEEINRELIKMLSEKDKINLVELMARKSVLYDFKIKVTEDLMKINEGISKIMRRYKK